MKKFKKIYIEITNICNLNCSFCSKDKRKKEFLSVSNFENILIKIKEYTDYIYLHVKGEPLLHPKLDEILFLCDKYKINVNITTNGTLLKEKISILNKHQCIKKINISIHCENDKENYIQEIFESVDNNFQEKIIIYRIWTLNQGQFDTNSTNIVEKLIAHYKLSTDVVEKIKKENNIKIANNTYIDKDNKFEWPDINKEDSSTGFCMALKTQLAILVDGTVVPCCLDSNGEIVLGNILHDNMQIILNSKRFLNLKKSFQDRNPCEKLCQKCTFKNRFK